MSDTNTDITQVLEKLAASQPAAPAIHVPGRNTLTYADLGAQIRYVRERLGSWNVGRGDIVVGVIPLRPEMAVACATLPGAATFAPLSPRLTTEVYCDFLKRLRPKAVLIPQDLDHSARIAAQRCGVAVIEIVSNGAAPAGMFRLELNLERDTLTVPKTVRLDWAYLLNTSGTTGRAKLVPVPHNQLASFAQHLGTWVQLTPNDVGCHLVPMHQGHGVLVALMTALLRGTSVICLEESDIEGFFSALVVYRLTWITAAFTAYREIIRRAADFPNAIAQNRLRCMKVSAGRLEPDEIERIERTFNAPLLVSYGATEARMTTHDPLPPRTRKRGSAGVPSCKQIAIVSDTGAHCTTGEVGEIVVRGSQVFNGYFDDPQATANAFIDGWFRTGDIGYMDDDGYLFLKGRIKDVINRGGEKISPEELDAAIATIRGVHAAATFGIPHPSLGEELVAAVVRDGSVALEETEIIDHVRQRMGPKRVPRKIYFVDELPRTDTGKIRRAELPRLLGLGSPNFTAAEKSIVEAKIPPSPLEAALSGLWSSILQGRNVGVHDDFFLLGGDSLQGARLLTNIKSVFSVEFTLENLFKECATVAGMARSIEAKHIVNTSINHE